MSLNGTSAYEMLRLLNQVDRAQLKDFLAVSEQMTHIVDLPRINFAAAVVRQRKTPRIAVNAPPNVRAEMVEANNFLAKRSPLLIPCDPTGMLPGPVPNRPGLSDADYSAAAAALGTEKAVIKAVVDVESGGAFAPDGRPIIRYELHKFQEKTKGAYSKTHPHLSQSYKQGRAYHGGGQANEWSMMYGAMLLRGCYDHALTSASWGLFQIMGFNYSGAGYGSVREFARDMCLSAGNQLQAFIALCKTRGWSRYLAAKDWAGFASRYNGSSYKDNRYDVLLAGAYSRHSRHSSAR